MSGHICALNNAHVLFPWRHDYGVVLLVSCPGCLQSGLLDFSVWGVVSHRTHLSVSTGPGPGQ